MDNLISALNSGDASNAKTLVYAAGTVASVALGYYMLSKKPTKTKDGLPYAPVVEGYRLPFLGAYPFFLNPNKFIDEAKTKCGDTWSLYAFGKNVTITLNPDDIRTILFASDENISFLGGVEDLIGPMFWKGFLVPRSKEIKLGLNVSYLGKYVHVMRDIITKDVSSYAGKELDLFPTMYDLIIKGQIACFMGKDATKSGIFEKIVYYMLEFDPEKGFADFIKYTFALKKSVEKLHLEWVDLLTPVIDKVRQQVQNGEPTEDTVISSFLNNPTIVGEIDNATIAGHLYAFLFGGTTNTFAATAWVLLELLWNPDIMMKVKEEIASLNGEITMESLGKLQWLEASFREVIRLRFPGIFWRKSMVDYKLKEYVIPKGNIVGLSAPQMLKDERLFPNPLKFDPARILERQEHVNAKHMFSIFGKGSHPCLGEKLAVMEAKLAILEILNQYEPELVHFDATNVDTRISGIERPPKPILIRFNPKKN